MDTKKEMISIAMRDHLFLKFLEMVFRYSLNTANAAAACRWTSSLLTECKMRSSACGEKKLTISSKVDKSVNSCSVSMSKLISRLNKMVKLLEKISNGSFCSKKFFMRSNSFSRSLIFPTLLIYRKALG